jgi:threonyl-tRNA synthetase
VQVLAVRDDHAAYASSVVATLRASGFRAEAVPADEPLGARVRRAKLEKIPYVLVVGDDDVAAGTVGVNTRGSERPERGVPVPAFVDRLTADVSSGTEPVEAAGQ